MSIEASVIVSKVCDEAPEMVDLEEVQEVPKNDTTYQESIKPETPRIQIHSVPKRPSPKKNGP